MRLRRVLGLSAALILVVPLAAGAQGNRQDAFKVTGGGQVFADGNDVQGAGDTVAFVAIQDGEAEEEDAPHPARGQFRRLERNNDNGDNGRPTKFFGIVTCIERINGNQAQFGGFERDRGNETTETAFTVTVQDNGPGDNDLIVVETNDGEPCDNGDLEEAPVLARGNLKVHGGEGTAGPSND